MSRRCTPPYAHLAAPRYVVPISNPCTPTDPGLRTPPGRVLSNRHLLFSRMWRKKTPIQRDEFASVGITTSAAHNWRV